MTPPCHPFPASQLPRKIQQDVSGRRRKLDGGASRVDLAACDLLQVLQYNCEVKHPLSADSPVQCFPVQRLFRRCNDRKGTFTVETTAWEGTQEPQQKTQQKTQQNTHSGGPGTSNDGRSTSESPPRPQQWSSNWHNADAAS